MIRKIRLILVLLILSNTIFGQTFNTDTTMSGTYNAAGKVMYINAKISGNVTLTNGTIIASPFMQIFDTTVILGTGIRCERFSGMWYGAASANTDNSSQLQYAINACINKPFPLYIPSGVYKYSQPLMVLSGTYGAYTQSQIRIYGDASFWDTGIGTTLSYSGDSCALGFQLNKGSEVSNLIISGGWKSPGGSDTSYYNLNSTTYTNQAAHGNGEGIWIDPIGNWSQRSGSTGCYVHDVFIKGFAVCIRISNSISQNGDLMQFDRIQLGDCKYGVLTSQPQEKGNRFNDLSSWGSVWTLYTITSGNYYINGGNIAGRVINLFNIYSTSWFPVHISNIYAEHIGTVGSLSSYLPTTISNCIFDFNYSSIIGAQTLITSSSNLIKFNSCQFRYYGANFNLNFSGAATYDNCLFSGTVVGGTGSVYTSYSNGTIIYNGSAVMQKIDTIPQSNSVKISIRSSTK